MDRPPRSRSIVRGINETNALIDSRRVEFASMNEQIHCNREWERNSESYQDKKDDRGKGTPAVAMTDDAILERVERIDKDGQKEENK